MPHVTVKLIYTPRPGWNQVSTPVGENHNSVNVGLDCMYDSGVTLTTYSSKSPVLTPAEALALARALALVAGCADDRWRGWHWEAREQNGRLLATTPLGEWYVNREDCEKAVRTLFRSRGTTWQFVSEDGGQESDFLSPRVDDTARPTINPELTVEPNGVYVAGPMSRASFCRCDGPSTRSALPVSANLPDSSVRKSVLDANVNVGHSGSTVSADGILIGELSDGPLLPQGDLLGDLGGPALPQVGQEFPKQGDSLMPVGNPLIERFLPESPRLTRAVNTADSTSLAHQLHDVTVGGADLDAEGAVVVSPVDDGSLTLEKSGAPSDISCPFHDFILPDGAVDPWDYNYPAFHAAAAELRSRGMVVANPAEHFDGDQTLPYGVYIREAVRSLIGCAEVVTLPGWENSKGARLEVDIAEKIGMPVTTLAEKLATADDTPEAEQ